MKLKVTVILIIFIICCLQLMVLCVGCSNNRVLKVGPRERYKTIEKAITAAKDGDTIFIKNGEYCEHIVNLDKNISIEGESREGVVWKYPNIDYWESIYECGMGSIKNLTMYAYDNGEPVQQKYGRSYCLHLDFFDHYQKNPPISNYFYCENVRMVNDNNECAGIGLRPELKVEFVDCEFETLGGNEAAFYVHSSTSDLTVDAECVLRDCVITNNSALGELAALRLEGYWTTNGGCKALFMGNTCINNGGGDSFVMQKTRRFGKQTIENYQGVSDWILDSDSKLNNIEVLNYEETGE